MRPRQVFVSTVIGREQDTVSISQIVNEHRRRNALGNCKENRIECITMLSMLSSQKQAQKGGGDN